MSEETILCGGEGKRFPARNFTDIEPFGLVHLIGVVTPHTLLGDPIGESGQPLPGGQPLPLPLPIDPGP